MRDMKDALGKPFASGNTADLYRKDNKVIKLLKYRFSQSDMMYEANKQKWAYESGLKVPKILDTVTIEGRHGMVMEYIAGEPLGKKMLDKRERMDDYLTLSVNVQLKLHDINAEPLEKMSDRLHQKIETAPYVHESQKNVMLTDLGNMPCGTRLCHGDFHVFNLLLADEEVVIIDWVDAVSGDPAADVFRTYLLYLQYDSELAKHYLDSYMKKSNLKKDYILRWAPFMAAGRLAENVTSESQELLVDIVNQYYPK